MDEIKTPWTELIVYLDTDNAAGVCASMLRLMELGETPASIEQYIDLNSKAYGGE